MRRLCMQAFQMPLFPTMVGTLVKELNHLPKPELFDRKLDVATEIDRALSISAPVYADTSHKIFFVSNAFEVSLNVMEWNQSAQSPEGASLWGKRTVTYFVYDPRSQLFAPSKFCAFIPVTSLSEASDTGLDCSIFGMTMVYYCSIDPNEPRFDGGIARNHFLNRLGYRLLRPGESPELLQRFERWIKTHEHRIRIHPRRAHILLPARLSLPT